MTTRRDFLAGSSLTLLGAALPHAARSATSAGAGTADVDSAAVEAQTRYGRIRGLARAGVCSFKGIPYGAPTGGDQRFLPPRPPAVWPGLRDCMDYGPICPQLTPDGAPASGTLSEDCLNLNLWTPGCDQGRRPVLVTLQGDGFLRGSANGAASDGTELARHGDLVVVGVNRRLGRLGYLHLADAGGGAAFAQSGVAGLMDLVAALEWVRDNAAQFGGDPGRVTLLGQCGGGAQVSSLLATRAAQGLFHRAAVQSGSLLHFAARDVAARQAAHVLQALQVPRGRISALQALPWQSLLSAAAGDAAAAASRPVLDGHYLTRDPFEAAAPDESATVPLIVSTTLEQASRQLTNFSVGDAELRTILDRRFPGRGREILALYRRYYPDRPAFLLQAQAITDAGPRRAALHQAELKAAQGKGAIYVYEWDWPSPGADSRYGAARGLDAPGSLGNVVQPGSERLASQLASLWTSFAHSGRPAVSQLPPWPGYDVTTRATVVFGTPTQLVNDPRGEIRQFWQQTRAQDTDSV